ncbi:MAG: response regulator [Flavobacteriaceae bacterium]|nr:response regulator [Flavobacteriaceae bacterium]
MKKIQNIFIVDDSPTVIASLKLILKKYNYNVQSFTDPTVALEEMETTQPELILLDYEMPQMTGATFMIKVSERLLNNHNWRVFLVSSHVFTEEEKFSMKTLGITNIFSKPLNQEQFDLAIAEIESQLA